MNHVGRQALIDTRRPVGVSFLLGGLRCKHSQRVNALAQRKMYKDGITYPGFNYYPRFPDQKDPPITPTKLFMVRRIRPTMGVPWWEKDVIKILGLKDAKEVAIIKNTPTNNARMWKVKHLIEVTPITMPYGLPDKAENGYLKENGEFVAINEIKSTQAAEEFPEILQIEEAKKTYDNMFKKIPDGMTLKNRLYNNWHHHW